MARTVRNVKVDSRTARLKLPPRREPYWTPLAPGCALGYRRSGTKGSGTWIARWRAPDGGQRHNALGTADDALDAGAVALDFSAAQQAARAWFEEQAAAADKAEEPEPAPPYRVRDACADYLVWLRAHRKSADTLNYSIEAHILPELGDREAASLTTSELRAWHSKIAETPARVRTRKGEAQRYREAKGSDAPRQRRSTANHVLVILKAALNHAWREGKAPSDEAWRRVLPFKGVDHARLRYLTPDECTRLANGSEPVEFRRLIQGALHTGCRYDELASLDVGDFDPRAGTLLIAESKSYKARNVILDAEGRLFFEAVTAGQPSGAIMFPRPDGERWKKSQQARPMADACKRGKIEPRATFHTTRHTYASLRIMAGAPLHVVARNLGHADTKMVEKHYGHLAPSYVASAIRDASPRLDLGEAGNVVRLEKRK